MDQGMMKKVDVEGGGWADLPLELLEIIHGGLKNCREIIRFRSVCRWWRLSTPPPPNKISSLFPLTPSLPGQSNLVVYGFAVYLVRDKATATAAASRMVSIQEESPGNLILRHPLSHREFPKKNGYSEWITATHTPIARFYLHHLPCLHCKGLTYAKQLVFVLLGFAKSGSEQRLIGLTKDRDYSLRAFKIELKGGTTTYSRKLRGQNSFLDYVAFKGRIIIIDRIGFLYVLNHKSLNLIRISSVPRIRFDRCGCYCVKFVISDGDLYVVVLCKEDGCLPSCQIYKLQVEVEVKATGCGAVWEQVERVGDDDKVVFIGCSGSFAVSAQDLPPPWKAKGEGKCIVVYYSDMTSPMCAYHGCEYFASYVGCATSPMVFFLGGGVQPHFTRLAFLPPAYADLFSPPTAAAD